MIILVLGCLLLVNALPGDSCQTTAKGIFAKRQTEFEEQLNRLRNEVAQGRRKNHVGEFDYAANMNVVEWQQGIANAAQTCSERCPDSLETCKQLTTRYGALHKFRTVHSVSQEWEPREIYQKWMDDNKGEQLVIARMKYFGCGRSLKKNIDKFIEYVVCFFDEAPRKGIVPYVSATQKTIGSACDKGRSSTYSGLCKTTIYQQKIFDGIRFSKYTLVESK
ncbi:unnamed protein product [Paramecium pentaurelia]|uniref:SCP domain-containing protein n=1 Tax=Paramecium pentaurelia TaxID=43138 RepID=A0A8S1SKJ9_9CILI|nr:unnamed protein product [Paramecium pentaurelia]